MECIEISKTEFKNDYNIVKIFVNKAEIMEFARNYKENDGVVAFAVRKQHKLTLEDVVIQMQTGFKTINTRLDNIETRLDHIVKLNKLKE